MKISPFGPFVRFRRGPWRTARCNRIPACLILLATLMVSALPARGQFMLDVFSTSQLNSNPNEISEKEAGTGKLGDLVGEHGIWLGYTLRPEENVRITPSYLLAVTLWGSGSEQNLVQHNLSLGFRYDGIKLFGARLSEVRGAATVAAEGEDSAKARLVSRIDAVADLLDSTVYTRRATAEAGPGAAMMDDSLLDDLEELDDDLLGFEEMDESDLRVTGAAGGVTLDSLFARLVDRLDGIADTLDVFVGTPTLKSQTGAGLREVHGLLTDRGGNDPIAGQARSLISEILRDLGRYNPPVADASADIRDEDIDESEAFDIEIQQEYAPLSLSRQPLIRNLPMDYYFYTIEDDAGADYLRASAGGSMVRYINTEDPGLLQYNVNGFTGSVLLEQRLSRTVSMWGSYTLSSDQYPEAGVFSNTQHDLAAQVRYVPSPTVMLAADIGYGIRSYGESSTVDTVAQGGEGQRITSNGRSTSLFTVGAGAFFRPGASTVLGAALGYQQPPVLNPRLTLGFSGGRVRVLSDVESSLSDDIFSWQGPSFQVVAMQMLPAEFLLTGHMVYESRDYGRPTITLNNGNTVQLRDRIDTRTALELGLEREFALNSAGTSFLTLDLKLGIVRNTSTNYNRARVQLPNNDFNERYVELGISWDPF